MFRKPASFALPLSLLLLLAAARPCHAATPITTFGVTATVLAGCKVSAATFHGTLAAALKNVKSSVSVSCSNTTQFSIAIAPVTALETTIPIGNLTFPLRSLMNYAISPGPARNFNLGGMAGTGLASRAHNGSLQSQQFQEPAAAPFVASNANSDTVSVAITY